MKWFKNRRCREKKKEESKCEKIDIPPVADSAILQRFVGT